MIVITGGLGYIGPELAYQLNKNPDYKEHQIIIFDNLKGRFDYRYDPKRALEVYEKLKETNPKISLVVGDVRTDTDNLKNLIARSELVFHLAAVTGAGSSNEQRDLYWSTNYDGTLNLAKCVLESEQTQRLINISSANVYGRPDNDIRLSEKSTVKPLNTYAKAKYKAEQSLKSMYEEQGLPVISLRLATTFGHQIPPMGGTRYNLVINKFVRDALQKKPLTPYGDGSNWRPYIHVWDAANIMIKAAEFHDKFHGEIFNAGFSELNYQIKSITHVIKKHVHESTNIMPEIVYMNEMDSGPSYKLVFDKFHHVTGPIRPRYDLEQGIIDLINRIKRTTSQP